MAMYDFLLSGNNFTENEKTVIDNHLWVFPIKFISLLYEDGWKIIKDESLDVDGRTLPDTKQIKVKSSVLTDTNDALPHEIFHAYKFAYNNVYGVNLTLDPAFKNAYNTEKEAINNIGNTIWTMNTEEFLAYLCTAVLLKKNAETLEVAPLSKAWATSLIYTEEPKIAKELRAIRNSKVDSIKINSETNQLVYSKNGAETSLALPSGGDGGSNFLFNDNITVDSTPTDIRNANGAGKIIYSYTNNWGSSSSTLLITYCDESVADLFQVLYEINGQLGTPSSMKIRGGTRYGWDSEWVSLNGGGSGEDNSITVVDHQSAITLPDKRKVLFNLNSNTTVTLPTVSQAQGAGSLDYHVFVTTGTTVYSLSFTNTDIKWQSVPTLKPNAIVEFIFTYFYNGNTHNWLGGAVVYE